MGTNKAWGTAATIVVGAVTLVYGLLFLVLDLTSGVSELNYFLYCGVLAAGGATLLFWRRFAAGPVGWLAAGVTAVVGTGAGLLVKVEHTCCMFGHAIVQGYPFHWLSRGGEADDPDTAVALARAARPRVDWWELGIDAMFWAYAGLLLVVLIRVAGRALRGRVTARP